jgi:hypothetical protein
MKKLIISILQINKIKIQKMSYYVVTKNKETDPKKLNQSLLINVT